MTIRLATPADLAEVQAMFTDITERLNAENGEIWNEFYPNEEFPEDVEKGQLYVLTRDGQILSAFALWEDAAAADAVEWTDKAAPALYFGRFGVHVDHQREGLGSVMLSHAVQTAREKGAEYLRLFVVDRNKPAMAFYPKNGIQRTTGFREEYIREDLTLREYGFEIKLV